jgi:triosephosphate isomerase (TIM)
VTPRKPLIAGNWKMNLNHLEAIALTQKIAFSLSEAELTAVDVVVLPPFVDLRSVQTLVDGDHLLLRYGAQDVSPRESGAYTGDISAAMLAKLGCSYVVVGHSERRQHHAEDDAQVNAKAKAGYAQAMVPIVCVGESLEVREAGDQIRHTTAQLEGALAGIPAEQAAAVVIAYEPIWAIGTGRVATPDNAQEVCSAIRDRLGMLYSSDIAAGVRILYGGSVKGGNAAEILAQADVDGALVGGASLDGADFAAICKAALPT